MPGLRTKSQEGVTVADNINSQQLKRLQTLYGQFVRQEFAAAISREQRLVWASELCGREIQSFNELTRDEAKRAIDALQGAMNVKHPSQRRKRMPRDQARRHALDGRHDGEEFANAPQLAGAEDLQVIDSYRARLGWERSQFDAWLRSPRSPLGRRSSPQVRTKAEANRVRWALVGMLKNKGLWEDQPQHA